VAVEEAFFKSFQSADLFKDDDENTGGIYPLSPSLNTLTTFVEVAGPDELASSFSLANTAVTGANVNDANKTEPNIDFI
jgi:hypothetical protein